MIGILKLDAQAYYKKPCGFLLVFLGFFQYPGLRALILFRFAKKIREKGLRIIPALLVRFCRFTCNVDIELGADIGFGLKMPHCLGIVIGGKSVVGANCIIMQGVTLGGNMGKSSQGNTQPIIGDNVFIGPGAKILGPVSIGSEAKIGANAVVINDIHDSTVAVGVPAREIM